MGVCSRRLAALGLGLVLTLAGGSEAIAARGGAPPYGGLKLTASRQVDARLRELTFTTPALSAPTNVRVLLPRSYASSHRHYPVLYLLHGFGDDGSAWTEKGDAEQITKGRPLIVVMPAGGANGYYSDWWNGGAGGPPEWETFHIHELIPWIDAHLRTIAGRRGRAVAGLSMGGFGAFSYAARHPDRFVAAASFSGAIDTNYLPFIALIEATPGQEPLWGPHATEEVRWRAHNPWDLAENLHGLGLTIRTGNGSPGGPYGGGDPIEAGVHEISVSMHERLDQLGIPNIWDDYGPGGHTWPYWQRDLRETLPTFMKTFAHPPARPSRFSFTAAEPAYEDYGWHVHIKRKAMEFSDLRVRGRRGFAFSGSGTGKVVTAPLYRPHSLHRVEVACPGGTHHKVRRANVRGRLRLRLPLGPANPDQQYTPGALLAGTHVYTCSVTVSSAKRL
jgi:S-formylglutathione hydrolase FrmB